MKTITVRGHSDDIVEFSVKNDDGSLQFEDECYTGEIIVECSSGKFRIVADYMAPGVWATGIAQVDEGVQIPDIDVKYYSHGYTSIICVEVPDDVKVYAKEVEE